MGPSAIRFPDAAALQRAVVGCERCPRLRRHCARVAVERRPSYASQTYWGRPVPTTLPAGGPHAVRLWIVGLAPAAHGANRTGRMFTGDRSGDFLFAALHRAGFASAPISVARDDGTRLLRCAISAAVRCAPPQNRPAPTELARCRPFLDAEWHLFSARRVVLALGAIAYGEALRLFRRQGLLLGPQPRFAHGLHLRSAQRRERHSGARSTGLRRPEAAAIPFAGSPVLSTSFHVSQQNTFTGRLTPSMLDKVLDRCRSIVDDL